MFIGEYYYNLDAKGRMAIPSKIRNQVGETLIITRGLDSCLFLYEKKDWEQLAEKIKNLPLSQANSRAFARLMLAGAMEVAIDGQGRILIPDYLRNYADLKKKIVLVGVYDRLEIWDEDNWNTYKNKTERESSEIAENLSQLGI